MSMALLYGVPLLLGSAGAFFAGSMFDEKNDEVAPVSESGASILSPQSTQSAPGAPSQATSTNTSSFMPSINISTPSWMGGPPAPVAPPQQQSSMFGGPVAPQQQQSSWFGAPAAPPPQQQSSLFGGPVAPPPPSAPTIVPQPTPAVTAPDALQEAVGQVPPAGTGPDALEEAAGKIPPEGTGPDALQEVVGQVPPEGTGPDALEEAAGKIPPEGTGPDALEEAAGHGAPASTGPDALEDAAGKTPPAGTGPDALEEVLDKIPSANTGPDALEEAAGHGAPATTGPDALEEAAGHGAPASTGPDALEEAARHRAPPSTGPDALEEILGNIPPPATGPDALSEVQPALVEPIRELQAESRRADRDALPEAIDLVSSLVSSARPPQLLAPPVVDNNGPTPVEVPTPVQVAPEEKPQPREPLNLRFEPETAPDASSFVRSNPMNVGTKSLDEAVELRNIESRKEEELKNAASLTQSQNFLQSNTPLEKQGYNVRATRRAKAAAIRNARDVADALRGKISPLSGGRNRRKGNRWTHRRKR